jgi:hypothetical protein
MATSLSRDEVHKFEDYGFTCYSFRVRYDPNGDDKGPAHSAVCEHLVPKDDEEVIEAAVEILIRDPGHAYDNCQLRLCERCMEKYRKSQKPKQLTVRQASRKNSH